MFLCQKGIASMTERHARRQYPIELVESPWERALWGSMATFEPLLQLIEQVAVRYDRYAHIQALVDLPDNDVRIAFRVDAAGQASWQRLKQDRRQAVLALRIQRIIRSLARELAARFIRQVDCDVDGVRRRTVEVSWQCQRLPVVKQLAQLERAVHSGRPLRFEKAWYRLTERAHEYLSVGFHAAYRAGALRDYVGPVEVNGEIIREKIIAPEFLKVLLPYAIHGASLPGRRPVHDRDEALASVLDVFIEITGVETAAVRRGGYNEPVGAGADFVRAIEKLFDIRLMPVYSTHAIARAKARIPSVRA